MSFSAILEFFFLFTNLLDTEYLGRQIHRSLSELYLVSGHLDFHTYLLPVRLWANCLTSWGPGVLTCAMGTVWRIDICCFYLCIFPVPFSWWQSPFSLWTALPSSPCGLAGSDSVLAPRDLGPGGSDHQLLLVTLMCSHHMQPDLTNQVSHFPCLSDWFRTGAVVKIVEVLRPSLPEANCMQELSVLWANNFCHRKSHFWNISLRCFFCLFGFCDLV